MILYEDFLEDIRDRIKAEPEASFDGTPLSKEQLLADEDKMNTLFRPVPEGLH